MEERIVFDRELREAVKETIQVLAKAVKSTIGPMGTNVGVMSDIMLPIIVNDGVTVAKKVVFQDELKKYLCNIFKTVSQNTDSQVGDGTSTSIVLLEAILLGGLKYIDAGFQQIDITKGIHIATLQVLKHLEENATSLKKDKEMLLKVATISANNDKELGKLISDAFTKVGVNGLIDVKDSTKEKTYIDILNGMRYSSGYESNMFINNTKSETVFGDCHVLIYEGKIQSIEPIIEILTDIRNKNESILIIADDYVPEALQDLAANKVQNHVRICAVKSPGYGIAKENDLEDIAFITGASIISKRNGTTFEEVTKDILGKTTSLKVTQESFTIMNDKVNKKKLIERVDKLKEYSKTATYTDKAELIERVAKLSNGVAVLYVHGNSPIEISEKKYRIEDAINATRCAMEQGTLPGGGVALLRASNALKIPNMDNEGEEFGFQLLQEALMAPMRSIIENGGEKSDTIMEKVSEFGTYHYGYDVKNRKYGNMSEFGILDPLKVTKTALTNASSVAEMVLTMNTVIY